MTLNQINWAKQHDWYISDDGVSVTCRNEIYDCNGAKPVLVSDESVCFDDFRQLRDWAGY